MSGERIVNGYVLPTALELRAAEVEYRRQLRERGREPYSEAEDARRDLNAHLERVSR